MHVHGISVLEYTEAERLRRCTKLCPTRRHVTAVGRQTTMTNVPPVRTIDLINTARLDGRPACRRSRSLMATVDLVSADNVTQTRVL